MFFLTPGGAYKDLGQLRDKFYLTSLNPNSVWPDEFSSNGVFSRAGPSWIPAMPSFPMISQGEDLPALLLIQIVFVSPKT